MEHKVSAVTNQPLREQRGWGIPWEFSYPRPVRPYQFPQMNKQTDGTARLPWATGRGAMADTNPVHTVTLRSPHCILLDLYGHEGTVPSQGFHVQSLLFLMKVKGGSFQRRLSRPRHCQQLEPWPFLVGLSCVW